jgi:hypothetical protein
LQVMGIEWIHSMCLVHSFAPPPPPAPPTLPIPSASCPATKYGAMSISG